MPTGNLPASGKKLWEEVHKKALEGSCKDASDPEACAAGSAWKAVKNAGWHKGADGQWTKKAELSEFSMTITKASFDKPTQEMRWLASASDTQEDSYGDNMTLELFQDFLGRIEANELAPEDFRSDFWQGGMPYLSVSHYPDLNGDAVPGDVEVTYIDGDYLKAKGTYRDTPLGRACFKSICDDLYNTEKSATQDRVRISIAFLDWAHKHKSNGFMFERKSLEDFCPECLRELIQGEYAGKEYLKGQLVHYAHTRVPVNKRTVMEVDKSMTTRKEDAATIVGEELAEELDEKNKQKSLVGKSEAMVIKADDDEEEAPEPIVEESKTKKDKKPMDDEESEDMMDEENAADEQGKSYKKKKAELVEEAVTKTEGGCGHPSSHFLVVEDSTKPTTWHLRYKNCSGEVDNRLLGAAKAALTSPGGHRGNKYEGPNKEAAISKLKGLYKKQGLNWESKSDVEFEDEIYDMVNELKVDLAQLKSAVVVEKPAHPLAESLETFKADYDTALQMKDLNADDKLRLIQQSFDALGQQVIATIKAPQPAPEPSPINDMAKAFSEALQPLMQELGMLKAEISGIKARPVETQPTNPTPLVIPQRRSFTPSLQMQSEARDGITPGIKKSETPNLRAIIERTT